MLLATIFSWKKINLTLMRFFRDLSRSKARRRLHRNDAALVPMILGKDNPMTAEELLADTKGETATMTLSELAEMDGRTPTTPIYVSIKGLIYDVSAGRRMYGPGKAYHGLVGKDATRLLSSGCVTEKECSIVANKPLTKEELSEADRWLELYHNHDKYKFVGKLVSDKVDEVLEQTGAFSDRNGKFDKEQYNIFVARGQDAFTSGDVQDALFFWQKALELVDGVLMEEYSLRLETATLIGRMSAAAVSAQENDRAMTFIADAEAILAPLLRDEHITKENMTSVLAVGLHGILESIHACLIYLPDDYAEADRKFSKALQSFDSFLTLCGQVGEVGEECREAVKVVKQARLGALFAQGVALSSGYRGPGMIDEGDKLLQQVLHIVQGPTLNSTDGDRVLDLDNALGVAMDAILDALGVPALGYSIASEERGDLTLRQQAYLLLQSKKVLERSSES